MGSDYNDFWFYETRDKPRNLRRYIIWFVLLFAFVTIGSILAIKTMYSDINIIAIESAELNVSVQEAKATNVNGYINGEVANESEEDINNKYLIFVLFDDDMEIVSTDSIEIGFIASGETKSYELNFKKDNISSCYITVSDIDIK